MPDNVFSKPGLAVDQLPSVSNSDNGKVLGVVNGKWGKAVDRLPSVTSDDEGKVLMVVNGAWAVAELPTPESNED